ncbi:MAG: D-2-hydroxyacid dehydrogenase [Spirochaetaceae bacterium]|nr:D-2-hydroxyacid dehydrogenase [Spirochaetaceae bacterium]
MKIVILDGYTLNPSDKNPTDLDFSILENLCGTQNQVIVYDRTESSQTVQRIDDAQIILVNKVLITKEVIDSCPNLKYIGLCSTGTNVVDLDYAHQKGITVTNVPSYSTAGVSQLVFSFILEFTNHVKLHSDDVHSGGWIKSPDFCYWKAPLTELLGKTLGIVGFGSIGKQSAKIAQAFGMKVICFTRSPEKLKDFPEIQSVSFDELCKNSDFITLHCPLTDDTKNLINKDSISKMKKSCIVINTARGPIVNEEDMAFALKNNQISGFACDVVSVEPMKEDNPLLNCPNCLITPHIAWASLETRKRLFDEIVKNLESFILGKSRNLV